MSFIRPMQRLTPVVTSLERQLAFNRRTIRTAVPTIATIQKRTITYFTPSAPKSIQSRETSQFQEAGFGYTFLMGCLGLSGYIIGYNLWDLLLGPHYDNLTPINDTIRNRASMTIMAKPYSELTQQEKEEIEPYTPIFKSHRTIFSAGEPVIMFTIDFVNKDINWTRFHFKNSVSDTDDVAYENALKMYLRAYFEKKKQDQNLSANLNPLRLEIGKEVPWNISRDIRKEQYEFFVPALFNSFDKFEKEKFQAQMNKFVQEQNPMANNSKRLN